MEATSEKAALAHHILARECNPNYLLALYNVGVTSLNLGHSRDAIDAFRLVKQIARNYPQIDTRIAEAEAQMTRLLSTVERCFMTAYCVFMYT